MRIGPYTVRAGMRLDNPAFPVYLIYRGEKFIGKQFSMPSETDCEWLERTNGRYVLQAQQKPYGYSARSIGRRGRAAAASPAEIPE